MPKPLTASFFRREADVVARDLIGCVLRTPTHAVRLMETEAYLPANDDACHASRGATPRTLPMFEPGGILYVYFIYGMHWCSNIVVDVGGRGAAVLLRSVQVVDLRIHHTQNNVLDTTSSDYIMGPGRLSKFLGFTGMHNGMSVLAGSPVTLVEDAYTHVVREQVIATPRIGIRVATELPLRYVVAGTPPARIAIKTPSLRKRGQQGSQSRFPVDQTQR